MTVAKKPSAAKPASKRPTIKSSHGAPLSTSKPKKAAAAKKPTARKAADAPAAKKTLSPRTALSTAKSTAKAVADAEHSPRKRARAGESMASDASRETASLIAMSALDKKALGLEILDVAGRVDYTDFLVVMTGRSDRQVAALAQAIEVDLRKKGRSVMSVEGMPQANWVLMDFGDVVVHIFKEEVRASYEFESLWVDVQRMPLPADAHAKELRP